MDVTHLEIRAALHGAAYPSTGDDLAAVARVNQAPPEVVELLERLHADDEFDSVEEVLDELNLDSFAIDDTTELRAALGLGAEEDLDTGALDEDDPDELDEIDDDLLLEEPDEDPIPFA